MSNSLQSRKMIAEIKINLTNNLTRVVVVVLKYQIENKKKLNRTVLKPLPEAIT